VERLAIFDVDFTLTKRETLMEFYLFMIKKNPKNIIHLPRSLVAVLLYALRIFDEKRVKQNFLRFIDGIEEKHMKSLVKEFYSERLSNIFYEDAMNMIKKLKKEGYNIFLISASPEFYLNELYNIKEVDKVIGTRFYCENGIHMPKMLGENCKGEEKVNRLMEVLEKENIEVDFKESYMFSDSLSDLPLFNLVGHPYLINYKNKHDTIQILKWK